MNLTPKEAAARLRVSPSLVYALLRARRLKASRVGVRGRGKWLIREEDLDTFAAACQVGDGRAAEGGRPFRHLR